ncbi:hypothetical protein HRH25_18775, partial [Flavisolibacter sp. BT320]|nr:hypothetical protein [Flavisolibacter longurius]
MFLRYEFRASSVFCVKRFGILLCIWLLFDGFAAQAQGQPCRNRIENNTFSIEPAVCENTVAILLGSVPTGGNRNYIYQWEYATGDCGQNSFLPIPFANGKDYIVPANADPQICYRRVVISGLCVDRSNVSKVQGENRKAAIAPVTTVVQPNCQNSKGSITIASPAPATGLTYSINGTNYTNTTGKFTDLEPGVYQVSVKHSSGCVSPTNVDTIVAVKLPTGSITPQSGTLCPGSTLTLTVSGGTAYQWYRNGQKIEGATAAT